MMKVSATKMDITRGVGMGCHDMSGWGVMICQDGVSWYVRMGCHDMLWPLSNVWCNTVACNKNNKLQYDTFGIIKIREVGSQASWDFTCDQEPCTSVLEIHASPPVWGREYKKRMGGALSWGGGGSFLTFLPFHVYDLSEIQGMRTYNFFDWFTHTAAHSWLL